MGRPKQDTKARFWRNVDKSGECWVWTGHLYKGGYGHFWMDGKHVGAHKAAYQWEFGPVPEGLELDHIVCDNPPCVRPSHLRAVTHAQNIQRAMDKADRSTWKTRTKATECPRGHAYDESNTYVDPRGAKRCKACRRNNYK